MSDIKKINTYFYLYNIELAFRSIYHAPDIGDEVKLKTGVYVVVQKVWLYDDETHYCQYLNVGIKPV